MLDGVHAEAAPGAGVVALMMQAVEVSVRHRKNNLDKAHYIFLFFLHFFPLAAALKACRNFLFANLFFLFPFLSTHTHL